MDLIFLYLACVNVIFSPSDAVLAFKINKRSSMIHILLEIYIYIYI